MAKNRQINVRFDAETDRQLSETSALLGCSKSDLVRRLTDVFLADVTASGAVRLDASWVENLRAADARSAWGNRKGQKVAEDENPYNDKPKS